MYSESDDGEDIYVEGNGVDNNNNGGGGGGYYTTTAPPNLNGGPGGRDRQQPPRTRSPSASFFAQPGTLAGGERDIVG